jgi:hypothetical protein
MGKIKDLIGKTFGRLTVIEYTGNKTKWGNAIWKCQCSCKNKTIVTVRAGNLISGNVKSCGCITEENKHINSKKYNKYDLTGNFGVGYTRKGEEFYFDLEDYDKIKEYCWRIANGRVVARELKIIKIIHLHQLVLENKNNSLEIDHKDRNPLNNRKANLRIVNHQNNIMNSSMQINNTSGFIGVGWFKRDCKWRSYIEINGNFKSLGYYNNKEHAIIARLQAELKYFGIDFAPQRHLFEEYGIT